jgi:hypothetical protein
VNRALTAILLIAVVTLLAAACGDDLVFPGKTVATPAPTTSATAETATPGTPGTPSPTATATP